MKARRGSWGLAFRGGGQGGEDYNKKLNFLYLTYMVRACSTCRHIEKHELIY